MSWLGLAVADHGSQEELATPQPARPSHKEVLLRRQEIYQRMVRQISFILMSQTPNKFSESVQRLWDYLKQEGIPIIQIQRKVISQAIVLFRQARRGFSGTVAEVGENGVGRSLFDDGGSGAVCDRPFVGMNRCGICDC